MKKNGKKSTLIASILSVVLSVTMLLGTTLAWFTDTVTNEDNLIGSGILDVELYVDSDGIGTEKGYDIAKMVGDAGTETVIPLFKGENWEPNDTEFAFIRVDNAGTLAFKYDLILNIEDVEMTGVNAGNGKRLTEVLDYVILDGVKSTDFAYSDWAAIAAAAETQALPLGELTAVQGRMHFADDAATTDIAENQDYFVIAIHMDEDAGNEYQNKKIKVGLSVKATQLPHEEDGFGNKFYDEAADEDAVFNGDFEFTDTTGMVTGWTNASGQGEWGNDVKVVNDENAVSGTSYVSFLAPTSKSASRALRPEIYQVLALEEDEIAAGVVFSGYTKLITHNTTAPLNPFVQIYCLKGYEDTAENRIGSPITIELAADTMTQGEWTEVSQELTLEDGTVALAVHVCSTPAVISDARPLHSTEIHWDNIQILKKPASGTNE